MAGMNVTVKPEIISWVLKKTQFENIASSAIELLNKWLTGEKTPTFNQVETVSKQTNIPFGYFFLETPPEEECAIVEYRTSHSAVIPEPSRNLMDTLDSMNDIQEWMTDYLIENGQEELAFVGSINPTDNPDMIAGVIRKALGLEINWFTQITSPGDSFRFLRAKLEELGILVLMNGVVGNNTKRVLSVNEFRAFTLVNKYAPLIFINTRDSVTGKLFSILHEAVHVWIGKNSFYNDAIGNEQGNNNIETICNAVAAEILVPETLFHEEWRNVRGDALERVNEVSKIFRCSRYVIARKALDTEKITAMKYNEIVGVLIRQYKEWEMKQDSQKGSGGNFYNTLGSRLDHRLVNALAASASEGKTEYTEVYRLTNTNRNTFDKLLEKIGGIR